MNHPTATEYHAKLRQRLAELQAQRQRLLDEYEYTLGTDARWLPIQRELAECEAMTEIVEQGIEDVQDLLPN